MKAYLQYALKHDFFLDRLWHISCFMSPQEDTKYVKYNEEIKSWELKYGEDTLTIKNDKTVSPMNIEQEITLPNGFLPSIKGDINTTIGIMLLNYLLGTYGLNNKLPYFNEPFTFKSIAGRYIYPYVKDECKNEKDIHITEYIKVLDVISFLRTLATVYTLTGEKEFTYPPQEVLDNILKIRKKYQDKHGDGWHDDIFEMLRYEKECMNYVKDFYKNHKTYGITMSGKALKAFKYRFVSIGVRSKLLPSQKDVNTVTGLSEGQTLDKDQFSTMVNNIRFGSAGRALATKVEGAKTKLIMNATHSLIIKDDDCKTKDTVPFLVTKEHVVQLSYLHSYYKGKHYYEDIDAIEKLIGKTIEVRVPLVCKNKGDTFCKKCMGSKFSLNEKGIPLHFLKVGGNGLSHALSLFHSVDLEIEEFNEEEFLMG